MRLLPKEFTIGLKGVAGQFIAEVWRGMGPGPKLKTGKKKPKKGGSPYIPRGFGSG